MHRLRFFRAGLLRVVAVGSALLGLFWLNSSLADSVPRLNTLYNFTAADYPHIGNFELSQLLQASDGDFYGVSAYGGVHDLGYVYKVSRTSGQLTHLHDFNFADGATPRGPLIQASDGYLYGTTEAGGANFSDYCYAGQFYGKGGCGTLFKISLGGSFTKVYDFYTVADGYQSAPSTGVIQASDGNFYGAAMRPFPSTTTSLFKMTPDGAVSVFHLFATDESEGYLAFAGLLQANDGYLYGTTSSAGAVHGNASGGCGTVFRIALNGSFQLLHTFTGAPNGTGDGCVPWSNLIQGQDGAFYGTTKYGGYQQGNCIAGGCGIVYKITSSGVETVLHRFTATADGEYPQNDGLVQTPDGMLYGATGGNPYAEGYGYVPYCYVGGGTTFSCGTVYKIDTAGNFTQLQVFGDSDGAYGLFPHASLILASDGNLYGNTFAGGGWGYGTVYRLVLNPDTPILAIDSFSPAGGPPGTSVVVSGTGFTGTSEVTFGGGDSTLAAAFVVDSDTEITTGVPSEAQTSAIGVTAPRGTTFSPALFYLQPVIDSIIPTSGRVGSGVTLLGAHFDGITSITFGGVPAQKYSYVTNEDTAINVTVPPGAQTGPIVVTNPGGSAASQTFTVRRLRRGSASESQAAASPNAAAVQRSAGPASHVGVGPILCPQTNTARRGSVAVAASGCGPADPAWSQPIDLAR